MKNDFQLVYLVRPASTHVHHNLNGQLVTGECMPVKELHNFLDSNLTHKQILDFREVELERRLDVLEIEVWKLLK